MPLGGFKIFIEIPQPAQRILRCGVFWVERHSALRGRDADVVQVNSESSAKFRKRPPGVGILRHQAGCILIGIQRADQIAVERVRIAQ